MTDLADDKALEGTVIVISDDARKGRRVVRRRRGYAPIDPPQLWERQPGEPAGAYRAFSTYRDMPAGERTLAQTARDLAVAPRQVSDWAHRGNWGIRVDAWDAEVDRQKTNQKMRDLVAMDERHANTAVLMQSKVIERLRAVRPEQLSNRDLDRWLEKSTRIERMARGKQDGPGIQVNVNQQQAQQQAQAQVRPPETTTPARKALEAAIESAPSSLAGANQTIGDLLALVDVPVHSTRNSG